VTLEPCSIYGRTPPCTDAIINNKISRVVIATADPNPGINGKGMEKLKLAGIEITSGILRKSAEKQNEIFFKHITKGAPFITSKIAASLDGKTAAGTGSSKWITSEKSRCAAKKMRFEFDCILTGIGTVLADDPLLVPEGFKNLASLKNSGKKYLRAVLDSSLNIPATSKIAESSGNIDTIIFISENLSGDRALKEKKKTLEEKGIKIAAVPGYGNNFLDLKKILKILHDRFEITSIFLECGQTLFTEFLKNGLIDKFIFFVAPKLIGGDSGFGIVSSLGIRDVPEAPFLQIDSIKKSGQDIMITAYPGKEKSVYRSH
jgi:diaminohydroxyphosphoribosylaminopyrimidine deaminase/5-amino-6-(5-phosphoribosylamino)uracil reductase